MSVIADIQDDIENLSAYIDDVMGSVAEAEAQANYAVTEADNAQSALNQVSDKLASLDDYDRKSEAVLHLRHALTLLS